MRYTYVRQHDTTDCAAACLAMVCLHYKKEVTITRLRDMMGTDLKGTNLVGLQKAANELGFTTAAVRVDRENFLSDFSLPCIAQVITDQGLAHFVVVFKKTTIKDEGARRKHMLQDAETRKEEEEKGKKHKCKDYVIIGDPGTELKKISLDEFYKNFTGVLLLMNPTSEFKGGKIEKGGMMKRYIDLLLPQKKLFFYAILSSVITTILGIASSMFNKILMDEVLPYGLNNLLVTLILVFSVVSLERRHKRRRTRHTAQGARSRSLKGGALTYARLSARRGGFRSLVPVLAGVCAAVLFCQLTGTVTAMTSS